MVNVRLQMNLSNQDATAFVVREQTIVINKFIAK